MKLLTKEIIRRTPKLNATDGVKDKVATAKFFNPVGRGTWYMVEYDPDLRLAFGYCELFGEYELGYFSLNELETLRLPLGMKIERDLYFKPQKLSEITALKHAV